MEAARASVSSPPSGLLRVRAGLFGLALAFLFSAQSAQAHNKLGFFWLGGEVTLHLQLGSPASALTDGSTSWNTCALAAIAEWNESLQRIKLVGTVEPPPTATTKDDFSNNVFFSSTIYGLEFDPRTLAVTLPTEMHSTALETDVLVNAKLQWDSYRGALRFGNTAATTFYDLRRVLLHEFGHVVGLDHPDEATPAQNVPAIMNSTISTIETLRPDDIAGIATLYSANGAVSVTSSPASVVKNLNDVTTFSVAGRATNGEPVKYAWMYTRPGGQPERLELAENPIFILGGAQPADAGTYQALVYTANGATLSAPASLTVRPITTSPSTRLANLSTRGFVGDATDALITGFVIGGTKPKPVLIRAIGGRTLAGFGVGNTLGDPYLTLFDSSGRIVVENDNWEEANSGPIAAATDRVGGFRLPGGSTDSALLIELPPGSYTARVTGANRTTGTALVEVYEADATETDALTHKLGNLSTRGLIGENGSDLIAGLVVRGAQPRTFLIRAIGPTLAKFGLTTALLDPVLTLQDATGTPLRYNDDWDTPLGSQPALRTAATGAGAFALTELRGSEPQTGLDSAIIATLAPGNYTARVTGFGAAKGVALVEIYELDR